MLLATQTSCTRKSTPSGKLRINLGAVAEGPEITAAYIWGHNKTFGLTFGAHISGNGRDIELPLKPGIWDFKVMAWSGANMFEGITRCGYSPDIAFQSGDVDVPIHITTDCSHPFFSGGENYLYTTDSTDNQIKPLRLVTCRSVALATGPGNLCENAYEGVTRSFRVVLPSYTPRGELEIGDASLDSLRSECLTIRDTAAAPANTNLHIPVGDGGPDSPRVYIAAFTDTNCSENLVIKHYPFGLIGAKAPHGKLFHTTSTNMSVFFMKHGASPGKGDLATYFGDGADGDQTISGNTNLSTDSYIAGRLISARRRIIDITTSNDSSVLTVTGTFSENSDFKVGDEVMWHVSIANTSTACDADDGAPYHLEGGSYGVARITSLHATLPATITIDHVFPAAVSNLNDDLLKTNVINTTQCVMQVIRIPNLRNLTISGATTLTANAFSLGAQANQATGNGGIIAIRVSEQLILNSGVTLNILQTGLGYPSDDTALPMSFGFQGVGPDGFTQSNVCIDCNLNLGMGGGVGQGTGVLNAGGGGGGHLGAGGNGGKDNDPNSQKGQGGNQLTGRLFPEYLMMGAAGGHGKGAGLTALQLGGKGGGIIMLFAREILDGNGNASIN